MLKLRNKEKIRDKEITEKYIYRVISTDIPANDI